MLKPNRNDAPPTLSPLLARFVALVLAGSWLPTHATDEPGKCSSFLLSGPEWRRVSVRDPAAPLVDETYLSRLRESLTATFIPWFMGEARFRGLSYSEIARLQNLFFTRETDDRATYRGGTRPMNGLSSDTAIPGRYRNEIYVGEPGLRYSFSFHRTKLRPMSRRAAYFFGKWSSHNANEIADDWPTAEFPVGPAFHPASSIVDILSLPSLGTAVLTWNEYFGDSVTHVYSSHADMEKILVTVDNTVQEIQTLFREPHQNRAQLLDRIGEFVYLGAIHSHFWNVGVFSVLMSQANWLLSQMGLHGISHGNLDFIGLVEPFDDWRREFRDKLAIANPEEALPEHSALSKSTHLSVRALIAGAGPRLMASDQILEDRFGRGQIEGLQIWPYVDTDGDVSDLEYSAHIAMVGDTEWVKGGELLAAGGGLGFEGIAIRPRGEGRSHHFHYWVRNAKNDWMGPCEDGEFCGTRGQSLPITGIRMDFVR